MNERNTQNSSGSSVEKVSSDFRLGILGGGQLGKMLCAAATPMDVNTWILDASPNFPAGPSCSHFVSGSFKDYEDVLAFGRQVDVLTIEIEHVNTEALHQLVKEGKTVHPAPDKLDIIKDKGLQKQFYADHQLPTAPFELFDNTTAIREAIEAGRWTPPFVQKSRTAGYDGRGVAIIRTEDDLDKLMEGPSLLESLADIDKELAVQVARRPNGELAAFPVVEMSFHPTANLVEFLLGPADIPEEVARRATELAIQTTEAYDICGLLSIEFFLNKDGDIWINEVAPRPHNSGHHTIEACYTSQFQQHLRAVLDWPLGSPKNILPGVMINLLGAEGHRGKARYEGLEECLQIEGAYLHIYGKEMTKPMRKMGHATVIDPDPQKAIEKARFIQKNLQIVT
ncbi:MAG: 5-(carboxyamino)imidazole ribonucleotide synthase [Bacteroidota bacterium]